MTAYLVAGSQAATGRQNHVTLVKMSQLVKTYKEDKPNDSDDSSESHDTSVLGNMHALQVVIVTVTMMMMMMNQY